jgi:hypothetical protein
MQAGRWRRTDRAHRAADRARTTERPLDAVAAIGGLRLLAVAAAVTVMITVTVTVKVKVAVIVMVTVTVTVTATATVTDMITVTPGRPCPRAYRRGPLALPRPCRMQPASCRLHPGSPSMRGPAAPVPGPIIRGRRAAGMRRVSSCFVDSEILEQFQDVSESGTVLQPVATAGVGARRGAARRTIGDTCRNHRRRAPLHLTLKTCGRVALQSFLLQRPVASRCCADRSCPSVAVPCCAALP